MSITTQDAAAPDAARLVRAADDVAIAEAASALKAGQLVAFPTETVYGLGADATNGKALARLFAAKARPRFNPLIVHLAAVDEASRHGVFGPAADRLADVFWPGPLTLVLPRRPGSSVSELATAGLDTIALRVPAGRVAHALLERSGLPVAAPSANRSGHVSATTAAHVAADLGDAVAVVLDDGPARHGIESTIVGIDADGTARLLRPGAIAREAVEAVLGQALLGAAPGTISAPGQLESHYAPRARLRLDAKAARAGEALIGFGAPPEGVRATLSLSPSGDLAEAAATLFSVLRRIDELGIDKAAVMPIPQQGLGEAINDRLARAAAPRGTAKP